jgi:hypothetical protein
MLQGHSANTTEESQDCGHKHGIGKAHAEDMDYMGTEVSLQRTREALQFECSPTRNPWVSEQCKVLDDHVKAQWIASLAVTNTQTAVRGSHGVIDYQHRDF